MTGLWVVLLLALFAGAQQTSTVLNAAGATVVEVISQNANGIATTRVVSTIGASSTSALTNPLATSTGLTTSSLLLGTTSLPLVTTTPQQVGPVGQPQSEPPGGPTPYTYTTTDTSGNTVVVQAIFTPTGPQTVLPTPTTTGTLLGYSQWLSMIGTNTMPASAARRTSIPVAAGWYYFAATAFAGLVGGAWLIIS